MAVVLDFYKFIDHLAPFATQMDFDNAGFLVGWGDAEVKRVLVALDITQEVVREAAEAGCELIVSHHPVIFHPVKSITDETAVGSVLLALVEQKIAAICAHTNLDAAQGGVNDCLARALELSGVQLLTRDGTDAQGRPYGIGRVGLAHAPGLSAAEYAAFVKEHLSAASVRFADGGRPIRTVAVGGGSCGSMLRDALAEGCDAFVTADVKYDQFLEAKALGLTLIDACHFATENVVCPPLAAALAARFPEVEVRLSACHKEVCQNG